jgi:DNA-binding SARP family transcriptional activator
MTSGDFMIAFRVLGGLDLRRSDGTALNSVLSQPKRTALLAYLAAARPHGYHRKDALLALFWPESSDEAGRHALRQSLYFLRKSLGEDGILARGDDEICLSPDVVRCDLREFERLLEAGEPERALELYGGDLLPAFYVEDAPDFEEWLERERHWLRGRAAECAWRACEGARARGDAAGAGAFARRAAALLPDDEVTQQKLIATLDGLGDRLGALRTYEAFEKRLAHEQMEPSPETRALIEEVRSRETGQLPLRPRVPASLPEPLLAEPLIAEALAPSDPPEVTPRFRLLLTAGFALAFLIGGGFFASLRLGAARTMPGQPLDSLRYVVFPFQQPRGAKAAGIEDQLLYDAMSRWEGVELVDPLMTADALSRRRSSRLTDAEVHRIAQQLGAGRFVRGSVEPLADEWRVHAAVYDSERGVAIASATVRVPFEAASQDSFFAALADSLLLPEQASRDVGPARGTRSVPARIAYTHGHDALRNWDLARADSFFQVAASLDAEYAQAHLWMAQVRGWMFDDPPGWETSAERAVANEKRMSAREQQLARAVLALAHGHYAEACTRYEALTRLDASDFAAWFGLGECRARDHVVVRDATTASGWRFRSSYHQAVRAYRKAFLLLPSSLGAFRRSSYVRLQRLLVTSAQQLRTGYGVAPDSERYLAAVGWAGDSLVFVPYTRVDFINGRHPEQFATVHEGVRHQRMILQEIAQSWALTNPRSPDAAEALSMSYELAGDPLSIGEAIRARSLSTDPEAKLRLAVAEFRLQLRFGIPDDHAALRRARTLADSLLGDPPASPGAARALAPLAVFVGRIHLGARLAAMSTDPPRELAGPIPPSVYAASNALQVYGGVGMPLDSLRTIEVRLERALQNHFSREELPGARTALLMRVARTAFPTQRSRLIEQDAARDYLAEAESAFLRGDTLAVRAVMTRITALRQSVRASELAFDGLYPEAWLLLALGDEDGAARWITPTLESLPWVSSDALKDPLIAGALLRTSILRADVAKRQNDAEAAARWAAPVALLWARSDPELRPIAERMRALSKRR